METRNIKRCEYEIGDVLSRVDGLVILLAKYRDRFFSFRQYANEDLYLADLAKYKRIQRAGINVPKLITHDREKKVLIFERFEEKKALDVLSVEDLKEIYFKQLFNIYRFCRFSKIEIDYMPENYILKGTTLYYIGEEIIDANPKRNLENYGLRYWIYSKEAADHLREKGFAIDAKRIISEEEANKRIVLLSVTYW